MPLVRFPQSPSFCGAADYGPVGSSPRLDGRVTLRLIFVSWSSAYAPAFRTPRFVSPAKRFANSRCPRAFQLLPVSSRSPLVPDQLFAALFRIVWFYACDSPKRHWPQHLSRPSRIVFTPRFLSPTCPPHDRRPSLVLLMVPSGIDSSDSSPSDDLPLAPDSPAPRSRFDTAWTILRRSQISARLWIPSFSTPSNREAPRTSCLFGPFCLIVSRW